MEHSGVIIAADIGSTSVLAGLVAPDGAVLAHGQVPTCAQGRGEGVLENIVGLSEGMREAGPPGAVILGVGIGAPGNVDAAAGREAG